MFIHLKLLAPVSDGPLVTMSIRISQVCLYSLFISHSSFSFHICFFLFYFLFVMFVFVLPSILIAVPFFRIKKMFLVRFLGFRVHITLHNSLSRLTFVSVCVDYVLSLFSAIPLSPLEHYIYICNYLHESATVIKLYTHYDLLSKIKQHKTSMALQFLSCTAT